MIATPPAPSYLATELRYAITMLNSSMVGTAREVLSELLARVNASRTDVVRDPVFASDDERLDEYGELTPDAVLDERYSH